VNDRYILSVSIVFKPRPPGFSKRPTAIFVNCKYSINWTIIKAIRYTNLYYFSSCGPRTSPKYREWTFAVRGLENHAIEICLPAYNPKLR
jgi:hypothetical protein